MATHRVVPPFAIVDVATGIGKDAAAILPAESPLAIIDVAVTVLVNTHAVLHTVH